MGTRIDGVLFNTDANRTTNIDTNQPRHEPTANLLPTDVGTSRIGAQQFTASLLRSQVERFAFVAPTSTPVSIDPKKVDDALASIRTSLESGFLNPVNNNDLHNIENTLRGLNADETNAVFNQLSDAELRTYATELSDRGLFTGGYDSNEKTNLFDMLAGRLDANNLSRLAVALKDDTVTKESDGQMLGAAIARHAPDAVKAEFIRSNAAHVGGNREVALAVAETIGGLRHNPAGLQRALDGLTQGQIKSITDAASREQWNTVLFSNRNIISYDTAPLNRMLAAVATVQDPTIKAAFFEASAQRLKEINDAGGVIESIASDYDKTGTINDIRASLTALINSDTTGVVDALKDEFTSGAGMATYLKAMINGGQEREIGVMLSRLLEGNGNNENPVSRFSAQSIGTDGRPYYENAQTVGYFAGAVRAATNDITGDRDKQANIVKNIFGTVAGVSGVAGAGAGVAATIINGLTTAIVDSTVSEMNNGTKKIAEALAELAIPRNQNSGDRYTGGAVTDFNAFFSRVTLQ